jgi:hypothetical protein
VADVGERRPTPQSDGLAEQGARFGGLGPPGLRDECREPQRVHVLRVEPQAVAAGDPFDDVRIQRPAQPRHHRLQRVRHGVRRLVAPERVDQHVRTDGTPGVEREPGQRAAQQGPAGSGAPSGPAVTGPSRPIRTPPV